MSIDRQEALRVRCKDLLDQLRQKRENLQRLSGLSKSRKREREDEAEVVTLTDGDRGPARAALAKPVLKYADTLERQTRVNRDRNQYPNSSDIITDRERHSRFEDKQKDTRPPNTKSCLKNHVKKKRDVQSRVTFQPDKQEDIPASHRHPLQPLLGYDWIAGVLDAEDSLTERSDEFFNELCMFRALNKDTCIHNSQTEFYEENLLGPKLGTDNVNPEASTENHQCIFSYRINSRLFPVPLQFQESCPVCNRDKSSHPHTFAEPAFTRVSIPCSALLPPYKYKAHQRSSFDPSDSLGLPSHCLSGWLNAGQSPLPPSSNLDLQSSLNIKSSTWSQNKEAEELSMSKNETCEHFSDVSRLARHNFKHFTPKRRLRNLSDLLC